MAESTHLVAAERDELGRLEAVIEGGLVHFLEVGQALAAIRDARLYRGTHGNFESYCRSRWLMSRAHAHRLINAAGAVLTLMVSPRGDTMSPIGDTPALLPGSESQARPLVGLSPEIMRLAWQQALDAAAGEQPTAREVQVSVQEVFAGLPPELQAEVIRRQEAQAAAKPPAPPPDPVKKYGKWERVTDDLLAGDDGTRRDFAALLRPRMGDFAALLAWADANE